MNRFQTIILIIFIAFIALAVIVFSTFRGGSDSDKNVELTIWGTVDQKIFNDFFRQERIDDSEYPMVTYVQKNSEDYENALIEAIAKGSAPDMFFITPENLLNLKDLIVKVPFSSYSERTFKDSFLQESELFIDAEGISAFPVLIDPLVMYWNRDLYQSAGLSQPPQFLDEFFTIAPRVTEKDQAFNINKSAVALGEYDNINHAKEILANLIFQSGNKIVGRDNQGLLVTSLADRIDRESPAESSLKFYTEFANPTKTVYSWNKSLKEAKELFLSGDLATYFGFASELNDIRNKNPNLNFDVASVPQIRDFDNKAVFGRIFGLAAAKNTPNLAPTFRLLGRITSPSSITRLSSAFSLPPVRRDLLSTEEENAVLETFNKSAIISQGFIDPDYIETEKIFEEMIESVVSGRSRISEAVNQAERELQALIVEKR